MRTIVAALCLVIAASALSGLRASTARAGSSDRLTADLDGSPIKPTEASAYFCHDLAYPHFHCFSNAAALESNFASIQAGTLSIAAGPNDYITIYSEAMYGGSYAHLAQNYDGLWVIGWNDRISSYKVRNYASGRFYQDWNAGGWRYSFCCNSEVPGLSSTYDNQFSSVYRD